jgi:cytoskeletal protein RodZ
VDYSDFGKFLTQQRELRGMSRDDVARSTRIPLNVIAALETGQVERLPARVFVVNYIKAYARVIGLEPDEAVLRYEEVDSTLKTTPPPAALERQRRKKASYRMIATVAVLVVLAVVALIASGLLTGGTGE